jgi:hypothetical protein
MEGGKKMEIELKKGEYFKHGERYFVTFSYDSKEEQYKMYRLFEDALIPCYGVNSSRALQGKDPIIPYLASDDGRMTVRNTGKVGGTSIPDDLLKDFICRFVDVDKASVKVVIGEIKDKFDEKKFDDLLSSLDTKRFTR